MHTSKSRSTAAALAVTALIFSVPAAADPLDITDIVGFWSGPVGGENVVISNADDQATDEIRWGDGDDPDSGYNFTPGPDILAIVPDTAFLLGTLVHLNQPIPSGSSITAVDYNIGFSTNGIPPGLMTTLEFDHFETPNAADPCANGQGADEPINSNGCADIVTVVAAALSSPIDVNGQLYDFELLGFSIDGGSTFAAMFESAEEAFNEVELYAIVTERRVGVPEPLTCLLMGLGLLGLGIQRRRMRRA